MHSLLGKARLILDSFDADSGALSLTELANRSGVAKATVHRIAGELVSLGLLERVGTKYRLGLRLFELGQLVPRQRILREVSLTYVQDLHAATRETVHLAIRDGLDVLYIDKISGHHGVDLPSRVAGLPMYATATGKAILAYSPNSVFRAVTGNGFVEFTDRTVNSEDGLRRQLDAVRSQQLAVETEEVRLGTSSIAAPIFGGHGEAVAAIGVSSPRYRMDTERFAEPLRAAADGISRKVSVLERSA
ncbi:IclR family transcriptional regulator [Rhodococcus baikonurensis]